MKENALILFMPMFARAASAPHPEIESESLGGLPGCWKRNECSGTDREKAVDSSGCAGTAQRSSSTCREAHRGNGEYSVRGSRFEGIP